MDSEFRLASSITEWGVIHIEVAGDLDAATADRLVNVLAVYRQPLGDCVVDLTNCGFVDSSGLRALLLCRRQLHPPHRLVLVGVQPAVRRVLELAHMGSVFDVRGTAAV